MRGGDYQPSPRRTTRDVSLSPLFAIFALVVFTASAPLARQESLDSKVESWFPKLESESWSERELAQRRLAALLQPGDTSLVRTALSAGGPETRLRLAHALADEDRLFGVAAEFAVDADEVVARAGRTALRMAIERFEPPTFDDAIPREDLWLALAETDGIAIDARASVPFRPAEVADLLALAQPSAPRIVHDVPGASVVSARRMVDAGSWREIARGLGSRIDGRLVGFGVRREPAPYAVRWTAVVGRGADESELVAGALVERWCMDFARGAGAGAADARADDALARADEVAARVAAARALCAHGMPTAIAWLSRAWREHRDDAALDGLLLAARRGAVPQVLQEDFARTALWSDLENRADTPRALHAALALARIGPPPRESAGEKAELARALADLDTSDPRRAYFALVALEGWAEPRSPADLHSAVRGLLGRAELPKPLRFQALRVANRLGIQDVPLADPEGIFVAACSSGNIAEFTRIVRGLPNWPPTAWADDVEDATLAGLLRDADVRWLLADAWLARGEVEPAAKVLARLLITTPGASERARLIEHAIPHLREAIESAARSQGLTAIESSTWFVLCGVATADERRVLADELGGRPPASSAEWYALGELCDGATGPATRARLVALASTAEPEAVLDAATRAVRVLRADSDDAGELELLQSVRGVVRADRGGPLDRVFRPEVWPPPEAPPVRLLREFDRDPARGPR